MQPRIKMRKNKTRYFSKEIKIVVEELVKAKAKHPVFATCIFSTGRSQYLLKSSTNTIED